MVLVSFFWLRCTINVSPSFSNTKMLWQSTGLNTILDVEGIRLNTCSSTARKISVPCYLCVVGEKNNFCDKTYLLALPLLPNNIGCFTATKDFSRQQTPPPTHTSKIQQKFFCGGISISNRGTLLLGSCEAGRICSVQDGTGMPGLSQLAHGEQKGRWEKRGSLQTGTELQAQH